MSTASSTTHDAGLGGDPVDDVIPLLSHLVQLLATLDGGQRNGTDTGSARRDRARAQRAPVIGSHRHQPVLSLVTRCTSNTTSPAHAMSTVIPALSTPVRLNTIQPQADWSMHARGLGAHVRCVRLRSVLATLLIPCRSG